MPTYDHSCLVTTVRNSSGEERHFGFLPPHGVTLAADEELNIVGHVVEAVNRGRSDNQGMTSLLAALDAGRLTIVSTPATIAYDPTDEVSKVIAIDNGAVTLLDPCWESSLSES